MYIYIYVTYLYNTHADIDSSHIYIYIAINSLGIQYQSKKLTVAQEMLQFVHSHRMMIPI